MRRFTALPFYTLVLLISLFVAIPVYAETLSINNVQIKNVGYTSATIAWFTNEDANSQVSYGIASTDENTSPSSNIFTKEHSITLTNLKPATQYKFQVTSQIEGGQPASSQELSFSTLSFTFEENVGNFSDLNATPTPTPAYVPNTNTSYGQTVYPYTQGTANTQPVYIIPPIIYQQSQENGSTLAAQDTQIPVPTPIVIQSNNETASITFEQLGIAALILVLFMFMGCMLYLFYKSRKDILQLKKQLQRNKSRLRSTSHRTAKSQRSGNKRGPHNKTYSFEVA